ncbi:acetyltransferase [Apiospora kogelbergensis]|uniref:Acetyltransferase n=1 Tax=Apiospora kogelbergensis TaxID=1337665 RepID=A0AAW0QPI6_9PEZI
MAHLNKSSIGNSSMENTTTTTATATFTSNNTPASSTVIELKLPAPARSLVPEKWGEQVRAIGIAEYKEAGLSLAQAFASDDLARYLVGAEGEGAGGSDEIRWRIHVDIMNYIVAAHCYSGVVTTIGADYDGGLSRPDHGRLVDDAAQRLVAPPVAALPEGRRRYYKELLPLLHDTKHDIMGDRDDDCYYLVYLGTKPSGRGRGYATKLIEDMAVKADAENRAMYLESSSLKNNGYYAKFGFEVKKDIYMGMDDSWSPSDKTMPPPPVRMSIMVREPQPQQKQPQHVTAQMPSSTGTTTTTNKQQLKSGIMATAVASGHHQHHQHHHHHINKQMLAQRVQ